MENDQVTSKAIFLVQRSTGMLAASEHTFHAQHEPQKSDAVIRGDHYLDGMEPDDWFLCSYKGRRSFEDGRE